MMYHLITLPDNTEMVYSRRMPDGRVKVYVEKPDEKDGFHHAVCWLPGYTWDEINGFSTEEIGRYQKIVESMAHQIFVK